MNDEWDVQYWHQNEKDSPVEAWLDGLDKVQLKSVAKEIVLLSKCGNRLRLPHSKSLGEGLFELRERSFGLRIYYMFWKEQIILLLHAGGKKSQQKDIKTARKKLVALKKERKK